MALEPRLLALINKLVMPEQDLATLSFCGGSRDAQVQRWLQNLPLTQVQQISGIFYSALPEIGRLKTSPENRLAILERLRTPIHQCLEGLSRFYLNQPLILPQAALKTATIAQAIQKHLLNAYLVSVRDLCTAAKKETAQQQALAIQRSLWALGMLVLRSYQLYIPINGQIWCEIHSLYQLACGLQLEHEHIAEPLDSQHTAHSIHTVYLQTLLLATARPNQMRQEEVDASYKALDQLAPLAELEIYTPEGKENLFVVLPSSQRPPFYKSHLTPELISANVGLIFELRTNRLVAQLVNSTPKEEDTENNNTFGLTPALNQHLTAAWNHIALRSFERIDVNAEIEITVGLTNIHFHLAEQQPFNLFLNQANALAPNSEKDIFKKHNAKLKENPKATLKEDSPWDDSFEMTDTQLLGNSLPSFNIEKRIGTAEKATYTGQHPIFKVPLLDRSPGGYGVEWRDEIPAQVKAGEVLGLREYGRNKWAIGVVRWVHQIKGATQLGIQVLAPTAIPIGIAIIHKTGGYSEYLRALQIPELRAINQPPSVITNAISFHEYNKARVYYRPQENVSHAGDHTIQLTRRIFATGALSQFGYRQLLDTKAASASAKDDFNSVWE